MTTPLRAQSSGPRLVAVLGVCCLALVQPVFCQPTPEPEAGSARVIVLPPAVPDPFEPVNRGLWIVNAKLLQAVVQPTARGYRVVVRKPVRKGINNFSRNLLYPDRLINNLLEGKWAGARDETYRFACNTVLGIGGLIDVASKFKIPMSNADFGRTFGRWGWDPDFFIMLPLVGPSNDRDTVGQALDSAANPLSYLSPYSFSLNAPYTYLRPYAYFSLFSGYNRLSDSVDGLVRFTKTQLDPYSEIEYAWTFARKTQVADFRVKGRVNQATLETMQSVFFSYKNPKFPSLGRTSSVRLPETGRRLSFTLWLQPKPAPVVYLVPGLGSHRLSDAVIALAELVYDHGYSAVSVSSTFNYEFMRQAATVTVPGYPPVDTRDLHLALTIIDHKLRQRYPHRLGDTALLGYSMGAFQALYLAGTERGSGSSLLKFDRYVAIDTPVNLLYGMKVLDKFYQAPLAWPAAQRTADIENTFLKIATLAQYSLTPSTTLPFSDIESEFLIGLVFRFTLRDAIYTSQRRYNLGVLRQPLSKWRRKPVYQEILGYSYHDYFESFLIPYYAARGINLRAAGALDQASDLRPHQAGLQGNPKVRLIVNENDFLLGPGDLAWLRTTLPSSQLTVFPRGGHLGNLANPKVESTIFHALDNLRAPPISHP